MLKGFIVLSQIVVSAALQADVVEYMNHIKRLTTEIAHSGSANGSDIRKDSSSSMSSVDGQHSTASIGSA